VRERVNGITLQALTDSRSLGAFAPAASANAESVPADALTRLFALVGHAAVKQIAHLEAIERHWKKRRHDEGKAAATDKADADASAPPSRKAGARKSVGGALLSRGATADDLEAAAATGTVEDEFSDSVAHVREQELLGSNKALLAIYGPMAAMVAASAKSYDVRARGGVARWRGSRRWLVLTMLGASVRRWGRRRTRTRCCRSARCRACAS